MSTCSALCLALALAGCKRAPDDVFVHLDGGTFVMGSDADEPAEKPAHRVTLSPFSISQTEVTNAQFARFVDATKYVTTAERAPSWAELQKQLPPGTEKPDDALLVPGSMVFKDQRWQWTPGASWQHPEGPGSDLRTRGQHPVVHVSWEDANAYAKWRGGQLPTEAQWEFAARSGQNGHRYTWGDDWPDKPMANVWEGKFPETNSGTDGAIGTAPVRSYAPNAAGLYDLAGNVWEWTADWYAPFDGTTAANPTGPKIAAGPEPLRVIRGGSFLCAANYCASYRTSARRSTTADSSLSHLGFRIVKVE